MLLAALATWALTFADSYPMYLLAALRSVWQVGRSSSASPMSAAGMMRAIRARRGIFGAGNIGAAAVTKFVAPFVMVAYGWQGMANVWAAGWRGGDLLCFSPRTIPRSLNVAGPGAKHAGSPSSSPP